METILVKRQSASEHYMQKEALIYNKKEIINGIHFTGNQSHALAATSSNVPLKAAAPARAIPYPTKTAAGVTKRAKAVELALVKEARAVALPVAVVNQSTASLNRKGT